MHALRSTQAIIRSFSVSKLEKKLSFETEKTLCTRFAQEASAAQKGRRCALSNGSLSVIRSIASINTGIIFIYAVRGL